MKTHTYVLTIQEYEDWQNKKIAYITEEGKIISRAKYDALFDENGDPINEDYVAYSTPEEFLNSWKELGRDTFIKKDERLGEVAFGYMNWD